MKKFLSLALCLMFCFLALAGCSSLKDDEKGASIRMYFAEYPQTLDPALVQLNSDTEQILSMIFEPLTTLDENGKVKPALATEWYYKYDEIYQQHKMYFQLKTTSWSDKRVVRADDVIYAWRRILLPETDSPYAALLYPIKGARDVKSGIGTIDDLGLAAASDTLLEVTFENYYDIDLFAEIVSNIHLAPCREDIVTRCEKDGTDWAASATDIVCNGKFKVQTMDMPRTLSEAEKDFDNFSCRLMLERNSFYMRNDEDDALDKYVLPYRITCCFAEGQVAYYPDEKGSTQEAFQAKRFLAGEQYLLAGFNAETYKYFADSRKYDLETMRTLNGYAFYFNNGNEILSDANARKALSAALDRKGITDYIGVGNTPATGWVPTGVFNTDRKSDFRKAGGDKYSTGSDMDNARSLLDSAAKKSGTLTVTYLIPQNVETLSKYQRSLTYDNVYENIAKKAGEYWESLGFTIKYRGLNPADFLKALYTRDYDIIGVNIISGSADALTYLAPFAKEFSGASVSIDYTASDFPETFNTHYTNFDNAEYGEIIKTAVYESDRAKRAEALHKAEDMLTDLCPATMVFWYNRSYVASSEIGGYDDDASWFGYIDYTDLKLSGWRDVNSKEQSIEEERANAK